MSTTHSHSTALFILSFLFIVLVALIIITTEIIAGTALSITYKYVKVLKQSNIGWNDFMNIGMLTVSSILQGEAPLKKRIVWKPLENKKKRKGILVYEKLTLTSQEAITHE